MEYNENQLFYASLWWVSALPGGDAHIDSICERYDKDTITFPQFQSLRKPRTHDNLGIEESAMNDFEREEMFNILSGIPLSDNARETFNQLASKFIETTLSESTLDNFFDTLFEAVKLKACQTSSLTEFGSPYIELTQHLVRRTDDPAFPDYPFSDALEKAIESASISRGALPQSVIIRAYADGQLFVPSGNFSAYQNIPIDYPGKPETPYIDALKPKLI